MFLAEALKPGYVFVLTLICCIATAFNWRVPLNHAHAIALAKWHADSDTDGDVLAFTNEDANLLAKCNAFNVRHANHYSHGDRIAVTDGERCIDTHEYAHSDADQ